MKLQSHIIAGATATTLIYPFVGTTYSILFFTASVLIDSDHYLFYLIQTKGKDWRPSRMFRFYDEVTLHKYDKKNLGFSLMHTIEMFLVVYILSRYVSSLFFTPILVGMTYHFVFDMIWLTYHKIPTVRAFSIIEYVIRKKIMIRKGLNPDDFYEEMFQLSEKKQVIEK